MTRILLLIAWASAEVVVRSTQVFRALSVVALGATALAVAIGRSCDPAPSRRMARPVVPLSVEADIARPTVRACSLDPDSGRPVAIRLQDGGDLRGVAWSPWTEAGGGSQLVGIWSDPTPGAWGGAMLVRVAEPDGTILDRLPLAGLPNWWGAPCWFPDRTDRVLLAGVDGLLYRIDFATPEGPAPRPIRGLNRGRAQVRDLHGSTDPRLAGLLLASLGAVASSCPAARPMSWNLGWLRLSPDAAEVLAIGRLTAGLAEESHPVAAIVDGGRLLLAYLDRPPGRNDRRRRLKVVPLEIGSRSDVPTIDPCRAVTLADDASLAAPVFSADGAWVAYVPMPDGSETPRVRRVPVPADDGR